MAYESLFLDATAQDILDEIAAQNAVLEDIADGKDPSDE